MVVPLFAGRVLADLNLIFLGIVGLLQVGGVGLLAISLIRFGYTMVFSDNHPGRRAEARRLLEPLLGLISRIPLCFLLINPGLTEYWPSPL